MVREVLNVMKDLVKEGMTMIVVTHEIKLLARNIHVLFFRLLDYLIYLKYLLNSS